MKDKWREWSMKANPYEPPDYDEDVVYAFRSMDTGTANEGQQQLILQWLQYVTGTGDFEDLSYRPEERATTFAEGKRFVGLQVRKMRGQAAFEGVERLRKAKQEGQKK